MIEFIYLTGTFLYSIRLTKKEYDKLKNCNITDKEIYESINFEKILFCSFLWPVLALFIIYKLIILEFSKRFVFTIVAGEN